MIGLSPTDSKIKIYRSDEAELLLYFVITVFPPRDQHHHQDIYHVLSFRTNKHNPGLSKLRLKYLCVAKSEPKVYPNPGDEFWFAPLAFAQA